VPGSARPESAPVRGAVTAPGGGSRAGRRAAGIGAGAVA